jgi:serine/threonine-protein kinase
MEKIKGSFILKLIFIGFILSGLTTALVMKLLFAVSTITLPDFTGVALEKAQKMGLRAGIDIKVENEVDSNMYEKGFIVSQDMPPKSKIKKGRAVYVVVSKGSKIVPVPSLIGSLMSKAVIDLKNAFLDTGYEASVSSYVTPEDVVMAQSPPAGENAPSGSQVNILKSTGPKDFEFMMPGFNHKNLSDIYAIMKTYGLAVASVKVQEDESLESGTIINQSPAAGYKIKKDTPVTFTASIRPNDLSLKQRLIKFSYRLDNTDSPALVKINVLSLGGSETVYNEMTQPGRIISASASVRGDAIVQFFVGTQAVKEVEFKLEAGQ